MKTVQRLFVVPALCCLPLACLLLAGCHVNTNESNGKKNVDIGTPFGSMKVNTDNSSDTTAIGISAYPGAVPVQDDNDKDGNNANVDMSFGSFHLGVKAATFQTTDSPDKVLAFYRKDLAARYGDVIACKGSSPVGTPTRTAQGLACSDSKGTHVSTGDDDSKGVHLKGTINGHDIGGDAGKVELRAGSQQHQHIVSAETKDGGTKIALVALDLPSHLGNSDTKSPE